MDEQTQELAKALQDAHRADNQEEVLRLERELFEQSQAKLHGIQDAVDTNAQKASAGSSTRNTSVSTDRRKDWRRTSVN